MNARARTFGLLAALFAAVGACKPKTSAPRVMAGDARSAAPVGSAAVTATPRLVTAPELTVRAGVRGFGLPDGCALDGPIREAALPAYAQFAALPSELDELALAIGNGPGRSQVVARGIVGLDRHDVADVPWAELGSPPRLARTEHGVVAAYGEDSGRGTARAFVWRQGARASELAAADRLRVLDLACAGGSCAALTTRVGTTLEPGASVFYGSELGPVANWASIALEGPADRAYAPLAFLELAADGPRGRVALTSPGSVAVWQFDARGVTAKREHPAPFGVFAVVNAPGTLVIAPGAPTDAPCTEDSFPLSVSRFAEPPTLVATQAAPLSLMARPLARGALVLWLAPVGCRQRSRRVVHGLVVRADGTVRGAAMSIADATGFAFATRGDLVSIWLRTERGLAWLRARCQQD